MAKLIALDVAILPPPDVSKRATELSAALPAEEERRDSVPGDEEERRDSVPGDEEERRDGVPGDREERRDGVPGDREERRNGVPADRPSQRLRLDHDHHPHVTLTQQFVREDEIDVAFEHIDAVLRDVSPLRIVATGGGRSGHTLWITIERTPELAALHEQLMEALRGVERPEGTPAAFFGGDGRLADVLWVAGYRLKSSFGHFLPHITLGHGAAPPPIEPFAFDATTVAACHLGRFCTCRRVLRNWSLRHRV